MFDGIEMGAATRLENFIPEKKIRAELKKTRNPSRSEVKRILEKAREKKGLEPIEVATLLNCEKKETISQIFSAASQVKQEIYGNRIVLFAPIYISNLCVNNCLYCGFRRNNKSIVRKILTFQELVKEVKILEAMGHKRLIVVYGEHPVTNADFIAKTIRTIYRVRNGRGEIRRVNVNAGPMSVEDLKKLKKAGIGTYQVFQETYHRATYEYVHPKGTIKHDYLWRLYAQDRAMEAGIDDVAIGALFGLYDWKFEVMGLVYHAKHLDETFRVGPHTISFPRLCPALNTPFLSDPRISRYRVGDEDFKKLVAVLRLAVPYTGLILTAREKLELRKEVIRLGVSQTDAGSRIGVGGYEQTHLEHLVDREQFQIRDVCSLDSFVGELCEMEYLPSWCTACYRLGRTGEHFMGLAKPGFIKNFCQPNAILTFAEYLQDYASEKTKRAGMALLEKELRAIPMPHRKMVVEKLKKIEEGGRDLYF